jgi:Bacterial protein of unknown function (DUF922)
MTAHFLIVLINLLVSFTATEKESINWRTRRALTWADFKGAPVEAAPNAAMTSTSILIDFNFSKQQLQYHLNCIFYPEKSWTKVSSDHILGHEQGHFDISELFTRKLHKALADYRFQPKTADKDITAIYKRIAKEQSAYQALYDAETNYSRNNQQQANWQLTIAAALKEFDSFANYP